MKNLYMLLISALLILSGCTKSVINPSEIDVEEWMRTHERGTVEYVDYYSGNYIVGTAAGYSVIESWGGITPREYSTVYAYFSSRGTQTIYNRAGNYFTQGAVVDSWLSWYDAMYILDQISNPYPYPY